jgi:hypothetical protein
MKLGSPVPMLWVIPTDLSNGSAEAIASAISRWENIRVWQINGAVAFSLLDILVRRGRPLDNQEFLRRVIPLLRIVDPYIPPNHSALDLEIPDEKFWVRVTLRPEETNKRSCTYIKSHLNDWNPFTFKAYSPYELTEEDMEHSRIFLLDCIRNTEKRAVFGESLHAENMEFEGYTKPAGARSYPETGFDVRCPNYSPCTWPWIDLYLRMRRDLPVKKRLSFRFFNETDPEAS